MLFYPEPLRKVRFSALHKKRGFLTGRGEGARMPATRQGNP
jgi:hypothetical protein